VEIHSIMTNPRKASKVHAFFTMGLCAFLFVGVNVQADTLLTWDVTGTTGTSGSSTAASLSVAISGSAMTAGSGTTAGNISGGVTSPSNTWNRTYPLNADAAAAQTANEFVYWTTTIAEGYTVNITSFTGLTLAKTSSAGPTSAELYYSTDGTNFTKVGGTFTITSTLTSAASTFTPSSAISVTGATGGTLLTWRLVSYSGLAGRMGIGNAGTADFSFLGTVTGGSAKNLTWGGGSGIWDTAANNLAWKNSNNVSTAFAANDNATVNGGALTVTNVGVAAGSVTVGGTADTSISGGSVIGTTLTKTGSGVLTLLSSNAFSGGVTATFGTLKVGDSGALGTQGLTLDGTTLLVTNPAVVQLPNAIGVGTNAVTMNFGSGVDLTLSTVATIGTTNGAGIAKGDPSTFNKLYKTGAGALTFIGAVGSQMTYSGGVTKSGGLQLNIDAGSVSFNGAKTSTTMNLASGVVTDTYDTNTPPIQLTTYNGMVWNGNFYLKQGIVQINGGNIRGTGRIYVTNTGGTFAQRLDFNSPDIDNNVDVAAGSTLTLSAASGGAIKFNGLLTGSGIVANTGSGGAVVGNTNVSTFTGTFQVAQTSTNSTGGMTVKAQTLASAAGVVFLANQVGVPKFKVESSSTVTNPALIACPITGPGEFTKAYDGDILLTGDNSFSGGLVIKDAGTVYIYSPTALGSGPLVANSENSRIGVGANSPNNFITITNNVDTYAPVVNTNTLVATNNGVVTTNVIDVTTNYYTMAFAPGTDGSGNARSIWLNSLITNSGFLKLSGGGNLYVNNTNNSYKGGTEIGTGSLIITNPLVLSTGPVNFGTVSNSYLRFSSMDNINLTNRLTVSGVAINSTNTSAYTANLVVDQDLTATLSGGIQSKGVVETDQKYGARVQKWGAGSLILSASNNMVDFGLNEGAVTLGANTALNAGTDVNLNGGKLILAYSGDCTTRNLYLNASSVLDLGVTPTKTIHFASFGTQFPESSAVVLTVMNTGNGSIFLPGATTDQLVHVKSAENPSYAASVDAQGLLYFTPAPVIAPVHLSYAPSQISGMVGTQILSLSPTLKTGSLNLIYTVSPSLPLGLSMDPTTGVFGGTPSSTSPSSIYTITAFNEAGSTSTEVRIEVVAAPVVLSYSSATLGGAAGSTVSYQIQACNGATSYSAPDLPTGLTLNTQTGVITGTLPANVGSTPVTVTALGPNGTATSTLNIVSSETITVGTTSEGTTPSLLGISLGHFTTSGDSFDWFNYSGAKAARVFISPSELQSSTSPGHNSVTDQATFNSTVTAARLAKTGSSAYIKWSDFNYNISSPSGNSNDMNYKEVFSALTAKGVDILVNITCSPAFVALSSNQDWSNIWEVWQNYYAQAYILSRDYGIRRISPFNEPNGYSSTFTPADWLLRHRICADAIAAGVADGSSANLAPAVYGPTTANGESKYDSWGKQAVGIIHTKLDDSLDPAWRLMNFYSYNKYSMYTDDIGSLTGYGQDIEKLNSYLAADMPGETSLPLVLSEFNVRTADNYDLTSNNQDSPEDFSALAANCIATTKKGINQIYLFKFAQTESSSSPYGLAKNGAYYVDNQNSAHNYGGATKVAEVWRLFCKAANGGRYRYAATSTAGADMSSSSGGSGLWRLVTKDSVTGNYYVYLANKKSASIPLTLNTVAWGLADGTPVIVEEVSSTCSGGVAQVLSVKGGQAYLGAIPAQSIWLITVPSQTSSLTWTTATEDTQVSDGTNLNSTGGSLSSVQARADGTANGRKAVLIKLPVPSSPESYSSFYLDLGAATTTGSGIAQAHLYGITTDSWTEGTATWANLATVLKQSVSSGNQIAKNVALNVGTNPPAKMLGQIVVNSTNPTRRMVDITDFVKSRTGGTASFMVLQDHRWDYSADPTSIRTKGDTQSAGVVITAKEKSGAGPRLLAVKTGSPSTLPLINTHPKDQSLSQGATLRLSVAVGNPSSVTFYKWRKNGVEISGASGPELAILSVGLADAGSYACDVGSANGTSTSAAATVAVGIPPTLATNLSNVSVSSGNTPVTLSAVFNASPAPVCEWMKNGVIIPGVTATSYTFNTDASGKATYTVTARNEYGVTSSSATVTVKTNPQVIWPTVDAIIYGQALSSVTLAGASGDGTFAFSSPNSIPNAGLTQNFEMTFTPRDTANYNTLTSTVAVTVSKATPVITTPPTASSINAGAMLSSSSLSNNGVASIPGAFAWTTPGTWVNSSGSYSVTFTPTDSVNYNSVTTSTSVVVTSAGPNFASAFEGASATATGADGMPNLLRYAMGANSASASIVKPVSSLDTTKLTITAIVRINDPKVTIVGESSADLSTWNTASPIVGVPTADQTGVTAGETQKQSFSVARGSNKTFLRLKAKQTN